MALTKAELEQENEELKAQLAAQAEPTHNGPHVTEGLSNVLAQLTVEKTGMLPPNMGGKPYIAAVDLAYAVKTLFVENDLVLVPNEEVLNYEIIDSGNRKATYMVIKGTYDIISKRDATRVTVSGIGDGIALGSAVTSNIASTNAMKNALLRTFLVTEQSAEDAAKKDTYEGGASGGSSIPAVAKAGQASAPRGAAPQPVVAAEPPEKAKIRAEYIDNPQSPYTREEVNAIMDEVKANPDFRGDKLFAEVYRRLQTGELAQ